MTFVRFQRIGSLRGGIWTCRAGTPKRGDFNSEFWLQPTQRGRVQVTADDEAAAIQEAEQSAIHPHYTGATREGSASLAPLKSWLS
jgi:hypothetical protein